jgi:hypothetical protein
MDYHDERRTHDAGDRHDIAEEIETELVKEGRVDCGRSIDYEERVAVRGRTHDRLGADVACAARPVLDNELLTETLRQPLTDQSGSDVGSGGGREGHDQAYRPGRIRLRPRDARQRRRRRRRRRRDAGIVGGEVSCSVPPGFPERHLMEPARLCDCSLDLHRCRRYHIAPFLSLIADELGKLLR